MNFRGVIKNMSKIEKILLCPDCSNVAEFSTTERLCSECWIKKKKKVKMKKGILGKNWNGRLLHYNNMNLLEKLKDFLQRNSYAMNFKIEINHPHGPYLYFTIGSFGSSRLKSSFNHWGLDWKEYVKEFQIWPTNVELDKIVERWNSGYYFKEENEDNDDFFLRVNLWLYKIPDMINCKHEFKERNDWGFKICCKCGLFEEINESDSN